MGVKVGKVLEEVEKVGKVLEEVEKVERGERVV
jgi:hypothetical protein